MNLREISLDDVDKVGLRIGMVVLGTLHKEVPNGSKLF